MVDQSKSVMCFGVTADYAFGSIRPCLL